MKTNGWTRKWDDTQKVPFAFKGNQWVGYDDKQSVQIKLDYVKSNNLGGVMFWSIETDDFANLCGTGNYPLITLAKNAMVRNFKSLVCNLKFIFHSSMTHQDFWNILVFLLSTICQTLVKTSLNIRVNFHSLKLNLSSLFTWENSCFASD